MSVAYDPKVIVQFADRLYSQAASIVFSTALRYGFVLGVVGLGVSLVAKNDFALGVGFFAGVVGMVFGAVAGHEKGFSLRLQAQLALCQLQVEVNTRGRSSENAGSPPVAQIVNQ